MLHKIVVGKPGNGERYDVSAVVPDPDSPLKGKTVIFLGSSVTEGTGSCGQSVCALVYLAKHSSWTELVKNFGSYFLMPAFVFPKADFLICLRKIIFGFSDSPAEPSRFVF